MRRDINILDVVLVVFVCCALFMLLDAMADALCR
jgi:hypothetical protein